MVAKPEPVSMKWQTVYVFLPILNLIGLYKIEKLTVGLAIILCFTLAGWAINDNLGSSELQEYSSEDEYNYLHDIAAIAHTVGYFALFVYLVRKWSKKWNEKVSNA